MWLDGSQELLFGLLQAMISVTDGLYLPYRLTFSHARLSTLPRGTEERRGLVISLKGEPV
jgi:hypothetical protein